MSEQAREPAALSDEDVIRALRRVGLGEGLEGLVREALGRGARLIPPLAELACEVELAEGPPHDPESWAPVHALRVLGGIGVPEGIAAVLDVLRRNPESEEITDAIPAVLGALGPEAVGPLLALLTEPAVDAALRGSTAVAGLVEIGQRHPAERPRISQGLAALLTAPGPPRETFLSHLALTVAGVNDAGLEAAVVVALEKDRIQPEHLTLPVFRYLRGQRGREGAWADGLAGADPMALYHATHLDGLRESVRKAVEGLPKPLPEPAAPGATPLWPGWPAPPRRGRPDPSSRNRQKAERRARKARKGGSRG